MKRNSVLRRPIIWAAATMLSLVGLSGVSVAQQKAPSAITSEPTYTYDTDGVKLEGTLVVRTFYGPPGFGETPAKDARDKVFVLKLTRPISVQPQPGANAKNTSDLGTHTNIREVQLFVEPTQSDEARTLVGKTVVAVGRLHEAAAPGEHTTVTAAIKTLTAK